jgi:hypothetical protein
LLSHVPVIHFPAICPGFDSSYRSGLGVLIRRRIEARKLMAENTAPVLFHFLAINVPADSPGVYSGA